MDQIRIVIADDHPLYREGVARTLMEDKALIVVGQALKAGALGYVLKGVGARELVEGHELG